MEQNLKDTLRRIKAIAYDLDGVATDGSIIPIGPDPEDLVRIVNAKDSFASRVASAKGFIVAVISGGKTQALHSRCLHMGIKEENLYLGVRGKLVVFKEFCERNGLDPSEAAYFGDDIPDTQVLRACGFGIAPADAVEEAKAAADYVTELPGGRGCVREGIELIMKAQDKWRFDEDHYELLY
ncbi:MAG: HAD hydrolase family protein [Bacteroidales bacterium]|nr:HAD hydrolase family protein [Bacteroidales bacterium]